MRSLAQIAGLIGMALFAINLILSARLKHLENYFGGLNRIYIIHHLIGGLSFCLLLFHPLFSAVRLVPVSVSFAGALLVPSLNNLPVAYGIVALAIMILTLFFTFHFRPKYQFWRGLHKYLGLAFFFAGLHVFFIPSDVSTNYFLRFYMLLLSTVALLFFTYYTLLGKYLIKKYEYKVTSVEKINEKVIEVSLLALAEKMVYSPGQFVFFKFNNKKIGEEEHPFSISSNPADKFLQIIVKNLGDFTARLKQLEVGTKVTIDGPYGKFSYKNAHHKKQIWIAGGIGITPFLGMFPDVRDDKYSVTLVYVLAKENEAVHLPEMLLHAKEYPNFRVATFGSSERGRITAEIIHHYYGNLDDISIFLCGPPYMMKSLREQFETLGVSSTDIHSEEFEL
jgi:predicted ferric reductase